MTVIGEMVLDISPGGLNGRKTLLVRLEVLGTEESCTLSKLLLQCCTRLKPPKREPNSRLNRDRQNSC